MGPTAIDRLAVKTLDQGFRHELEAGSEAAPHVSQAILDLAREVFSLDAVSGDPAARLCPDQIRQVIAAGAPRGHPLRQTHMVGVTWALYGGKEHLDVLRRCDPDSLVSSAHLTAHY